MLAANGGYTTKLHITVINIGKIYYYFIIITSFRTAKTFCSAKMKNISPQFFLFLFCFLFASIYASLFVSPLSHLFGMEIQFWMSNSTPSVCMMAMMMMMISGLCVCACFSKQLSTPLQFYNFIYVTFHFPSPHAPPVHSFDTHMNLYYLFVCLFGVFFI